MPQTTLRVALIFCLGLGGAAPAYAQGGTTAQKPKPPAPARPAPAKSLFRAYGQFDRMAMSASDSFDAIFGSSSLTGFGAGVEALDLWKGVFARGTFGFRRDSGTRVIVADGQVIDMGIPLEMSMNDFTVGGGWRQTVHPRVIAYGGAGLVRVSYSEKSDFATEESMGFGGTSVFGGVELPLSGWLMAGAEVEWRSVPDALGEFPSVSRAFNETNLGGTALRVLVGIRR